MLKNAIMSFVGAVGILASAPANAKNITADLAQIEEVLQDQGYRAKIEEADGQRWIDSAMSGYNYIILPFGCDDMGKNCK